MCKASHIKYDTLNHKGLLVEKFHRFINKDITIAAGDRDKNDVFVIAGVAAGYAWNSSPIDGTDVLCSIPTIEQELQFPLGIDLSTLPTIVSNNAESVTSYLRLTNSNRYFLSPS